MDFGLDHVKSAPPSGAVRSDLGGVGGLFCGRLADVFATADAVTGVTIF
ncbi:MAG TPA: hypothetical protein VHU85_00175 [Acidimicrobiales bacterium]|jgi:hypothetical protein|nr:hypothetical protein [Acidimicrobiales bacterium]